MFIGNLLTVATLYLEKESPQDNGGAVYERNGCLADAERSVYAEPNDLCATTSRNGTSDKHNSRNANVAVCGR